jgi:hypothetical protein
MIMNANVTEAMDGLRMDRYRPNNTVGNQVDNAGTNMNNSSASSKAG